MKRRNSLGGVSKLYARQGLRGFMHRSDSLRIIFAIRQRGHTVASHFFVKKPERRQTAGDIKLKREYGSGGQMAKKQKPGYNQATPRQFRESASLVHLFGSTSAISAQ